MLKALAQMPDSQIDYTEIPEIDWTQVKIVKKSTKKQIAFRVDSDILEFFQKKGKGYQTKMNEVLKSFVQHELA
ncbi:MAG: BrnA antitoxin family protein [Candidatus Parcubacteria bacterium]|nr:BrnA antitoxin family protein [Candidatus Paceibacterota bacterium]